MGIFGKFFKKKKVDRLIKALEHDDPDVRQDAARALGELLLKGDWHRCIVIVQALGRMRCRAASPDICMSLSSVLTARKTLWTLNMVKASQMDPALLEYCYHAITALGEIGDPGAKDTLESIRKRKHELFFGTVDLRKEAKLALRKIEKREKSRVKGGSLA